MSVGRPNLAELLTKLVASSAEIREEGAENVCDWSESFDDFEAKVAVRVLSAVAAAESDAKAREAQINAIVEIFDASSMDIGDIAPVFSIGGDDLGPSERIYLVELREKLE